MATKKTAKKAPPATTATPEPGPVLAVLPAKTLRINPKTNELEAVDTDQGSLSLLEVGFVLLALAVVLIAIRVF